MKKIYFTLSLLLCTGLFSAQVGINTTTPLATLDIRGKNPATNIEGILIPRFSGDEIFKMPISESEGTEGILVYATSAASPHNQKGTGVNLKGKGFYYWDSAVSHWVTIQNNTTTVNNILAYVKPMNMLLSDNDTYVIGRPLVAPTGPAIKLFDVDFNNAADFKIINNPLNVTMWDNSAKLIRIPQQLLGYTMTINVSLKFQKLSSNAEASRLVAFTGQTVVNTSNGTYSGGTKIKDLMFTGTKTAVGTEDLNYVRDELVLSPIIITQEIIDKGVKLYIGSAMNGSINFFEPILTIDYGVVNTAAD